MQDAHERLRISLWVAITVLVAGIPPIWRIGYYTLVRPVVCAVSIYAIATRRDLDSRYTVAPGAIAPLFNPVFPVYLNKMLWVPIDLGVAYFFWRLAERPPEVSAGEPEAGSDPPPAS